MSGFVYVMTNRAFEGWIKIGMTTKHPLHRANELHTTGVPFPFKIAFAVWVHDPVKAERETHAFFADCRLCPEREFFDVSVEEVAKFVLSRFVLLSNTVVDVDEVFTDSEMQAFCDKSDLEHSAFVTKMLVCVSDDAIKAAADKYRKERDDRRARHAQNKEVAT